MKKRVIFIMIFLATIALLWVVAFGDFAEWRYSKNLHCMTFQNSRKVEICKSIEKYQEYGLFGHATISAGYRSSFATARKAWCELTLTEADLTLLKDMQYDYSISPQLMNGSGMLYGLLDASVNLGSSLYIGSVYDIASPDYLILDGCPK
jgi:hypothetical protein